MTHKPLLWMLAIWLLVTTPGVVLTAHRDPNPYYWHTCAFIEGVIAALVGVTYLALNWAERRDIKQI